MQIRTSKIMNKTPKKYSHPSSREHRKYKVQIAFLVSVSIKLWIYLYFQFYLTDTRNVICTLYLRCSLDENREYFLDVLFMVLLPLNCIFLVFCYTYICVCVCNKKYKNEQSKPGIKLLIFVFFTILFFTHLFLQHFAQLECQILVLSFAYFIVHFTSFLTLSYTYIYRKKKNTLGETLLKFKSVKFSRLIYVLCISTVPKILKNIQLSYEYILLYTSLSIITPFSIFVTMINNIMFCKNNYNDNSYQMKIIAHTCK